MKPILFNTEMVKSILDGRKTVTRRVVKAPNESVYRQGGLIWYDPMQNQETKKCPKYRVGDILYVRETWTCMRDIETGHRDYFYAANQKDYDTVSTTYLCNDDGFDTGRPFPWKPSIHMPKEAARIFLRVTDVRVERLQDITAQGIRDEGLTSMCVHAGDMEIAQAEFALLWNSTIKPADMPLYGWDASPWVWVYEFERCEKEESI